MGAMDNGFFTIFITYVLGVTCNEIFNHGQVTYAITASKVFSDSRIDKPEWIVINRTKQFKNKLFVKQNSCVRYCIENSYKHPISEHSSVESNYINLFWQIGLKNSVKLSGRPNKQNENNQHSEYKESNNAIIDNDPKCQIQLKIDCNEFSEFHRNDINNRFTVLLENIKKGYSENQFNIDDNTKYLQVKLIGNLSWLLLQIPSTGKKAAQVKLSLIRSDEDNLVQFMIENASSGTWRLKLKGSSDNETYNLIISQSSGESIPAPIYSKKLPDVNHEIDSYKKDLENRGIVIYFEDKESSKSHLAALKDSKDESFDQIINRANNSGVVFQDSREELLSKLSINGEIEEDDDDLELDELSKATAITTKANRQLVVDLDPETLLIARSGSDQWIVFTVTNNEKLELFHTFSYRSSQFQVANIVPPYGWIRAGETIKVGLHVIIPTVNDNVVNTITLSVQRGRFDRIVQKSAYLYVQSTTNFKSDYTSPTIDYSFYDTCSGKLNEEYCAISRWSVKITVTDNESGLKRVSTQPAGIYPRTDFIAGTKSSVDFIYTSTCCHPTVQVSATDVNGNNYSRTIDVSAWYNLTGGEITAIVLGILFLLFIIIIIVLICIYWARRRKSADLTYSQRYGSRSAPTTRGVERTSF